MQTATAASLALAFQVPTGSEWPDAGTADPHRARPVAQATNAARRDDTFM
jgi:hypothetical protein